MAIRAKPQQIPATQIDALIEKGGSVASEPAPERQATVKPSLIQLRLPPEVVKRIDRARNKRAPRPTRHAWMLEGLYQKLRAEE
jgi:hypothetical protein